MRHVLVAGVFTPRLLKLEKPSLDGGAAVLQEGPEDAPGLGNQDGMDTAQPLSPGTPKQFVQDRLRLVIEGVRGGDSVRLASRYQFPKKSIAKVTGGLLQGFMEGGRGGRGIRAMQVEWQAVSCGEAGNKCLVFVGSGSSNPVVNVDDGKHDTQRVALLDQAAEQSHGVGPTGDCGSNPLAGTKEGVSQSGRLHHCIFADLHLSWNRYRTITQLHSYTAGMYQIRAATPADAAIITHHRRRMFVDAGRQDNRILDVMAEHFKPWVETRLADGRYLGWLTTEGGKVIAGAGLIVLDWPPHPLDPRQDKRGYLLNVYVEPEHRRKKLASHLIDQALAEARKQKIRVVALHSTDAGKPLYESNGFRRTDEMFYVESVEG
jgi:ribosomal protein S18 acetylase RimI-like enzyme